MAGVRLHPGMRVVLGAVLIAVGLARHDATPLRVMAVPSFGDVNAGPPWLAALVSYLPAEPVVHSAARALDGVASMSAHDLAVLLLWGGAGMLVSRRWFRWDS